MDEPNAVWTVDFKGQFKMRNGRYCYPLTIQDGFSRFLLEWEAEACIPHRSSSPSLYSSRLSVSSAYPPSSAPTTARPSLPSASLDSHGSAPGGSVSISVLRPSSPESRSRTAATNACTENSQARSHSPAQGQPQCPAAPLQRLPPHLQSHPPARGSSTMRLPNQSTDRLLELTPRPSLLSSTPNTSRSVKSLQMEASDGTRVGSTSARRWATSSSASNPSVPRCGSSTSVPLPSGGLTKNSSSFSTPTATQDVTQSVNHQLAPLC